MGAVAFSTAERVRLLSPAVAGARVVSVDPRRMRGAHRGVARIRAWAAAKGRRLRERSRLRDVHGSSGLREQHVHGSGRGAGVRSNALWSTGTRLRADRRRLRQRARLRIVRGSGRVRGRSVRRSGRRGVRAGDVWKSESALWNGRGRLRRHPPVRRLSGERRVFSGALRDGRRGSGHGVCAAHVYPGEYPLRTGGRRLRRPARLWQLHIAGDVRRRCVRVAAGGRYLQSDDLRSSGLQLRRNGRWVRQPARLRNVCRLPDVRGRRQAEPVRNLFGSRFGGGLHAPNEVSPDRFSASSYCPDALRFSSIFVRIALSTSS